ncbi:MAG: hydrogenase maturation protease [Candidatus Brocadia sp. AMX2]|uniref:Ni-Fe-hydrogenase maturation factor n=1 Tax=Candidatus Brocadia sinica JPN1 TaxID=1197129 RepID=A0ABQ0K2J1_9BACT|nr:MULTISPECIES: hydrogenase maturation protease [Brocadia]KXK25673.1 MAG: hydrogenase maturation protease [Candidatus Brocadia sinica]MBC6932675.1 hydrogenase maturation protease [Candidatus Brocadia sp.]MBL1169567.1 hydrogenase maturation protease [Candidatus Brocadia sp. AMX1]NOG43001.1 hydrogenase maturation protease [Planctomycetota bacterium]KAA0243893.1 MAG: hydrogenase maturation protease [Candidatus Brocadia sp. AMX2]
MVTEQVAQNKHGILIIGIGNAYRGDDAVGLHVAQCLKKQAHDHVHVIEESGEGASLMECWKDANSVILIDAVSSGAKPGTIHRLDAHTQPIPTNFFHYSTHAFGVAEAIELSRALNQMPRRLIVYGIEGKCFEAGVELSFEVEKAAQEVARCVQQDIQNFGI